MGREIQRFYLNTEFLLRVKWRDCTRSASENLAGIPAFLQRQVAHQHEDDLAALFKRAEGQLVGGTRPMVSL